MSQSLNRASSAKLTIRLAPKEASKTGLVGLAKDYKGKGIFGRALKDLQSYAINYFTAYTMAELQDIMEVMASLLGDYLAEIVKSKMVVYGTPSNEVHVVTGSLMESIENQSTPKNVRKQKTSVRSQIYIGVDSSQTRHERDADIAAGATVVSPIATNESVLGYGSEKIAEMITESELGMEAQIALDQVMSFGFKGWEQAATMLEYRTRSLAEQNATKIRESALARIVQAQRYKGVKK